MAPSNAPTMAIVRQLRGAVTKYLNFRFGSRAQVREVGMQSFKRDLFRLDD